MSLSLLNLEEEAQEDDGDRGSGSDKGSEGSEEEVEAVVLNDVFHSKLHLTVASPRTPDGTPRTPPHSSRPTTAGSRKREQSVYELLQAVNYDQIIAAKDEFNDGGINLKDFVGLFHDTNKGRPLDERTLTQLCQLFKEVDTNGDNEVSLEELTSFIVQCGIEPNFKQYIKQYEQVPIRNDSHLFGLQKVKYFADLDRVAICDKNKEGSIKLMRFHTYNNETGLRMTKELKGHTGAVLNCDYDKETSLFASSSLDNTVRIWDTNNHYRPRFFNTRHPQLALTFASNPSRLITSDTLGLVHVWDLKGDGPCQSIAEFMRHSDMAMDIATIPNTPLLASASLDSKIILWDLSSGGATRELCGHTKGVFSLGYAPDYRVLLSAGSDRVALAWNPIANRSTPIFRLKGHHTSLVGVDTGRAPLVVTADISGWFKLWDIRTYECIQTFKTDPILEKAGDEGELISFTTCGQHNMLLAGGNMLLALKYDRPTVPFLTDEHPLFFAAFNPASLTILTASKKSLKVWDAHSGCLLHTLKGMCQHITAACIDKSGRRIFVGDSDGNINVYNYSNGTNYRSYDKHSSQVLRIIECPITRSVISCSAQTIFLHHSLEHLSNSYPPLVNTLTRALEVKTDITSLAYSPQLALIAAACFGRSESVLMLWDGNTGALDASFSPNEVEITGVQFLDPYPVVITSDSSGTFVFSTVRPHPQKYRVLYSMENFCNGTLTSPIQEMDFFPADKLLFTGDESGEIKAWNLHNFILYSNLLPVEIGSNNNVTYKSKAPKIGNIPEPSVMEGSFGGSSFESFFGPFLMYKWKGHHSGLSCLGIVPLEPSPTLISTGKDGRARMWSLTGEYLGTLRDRRDQAHADSWQFQPPTPDYNIERLEGLMNQTYEMEGTQTKPKIQTNQFHQRPNTSPTRKRPNTKRKKPLLSPHQTHRTPNLTQNPKEIEEEHNLLTYLNQVTTQKKYSDNQKKAAEKLMMALDSLNS